MKIISWNCQGAFRKKHENILATHPDIVVIQECEHPSKLKFGELTPHPFDHVWFGTNEAKGVLVYTRSEFSLTVHPLYLDKFRYIIPIIVKGEGTELILFAVWAMDDKINKHRRYVGQLWEAMQYYSSLLNQPVVIIGDYNSNKIWDHEKRVANHSDLTADLASYDIQSMYHQQNKEEQGEEKTPTFYLYRDVTKPYHLDYCYVSDVLKGKKSTIEIGEVNEWINKSDHMPLFVEF